MIYNNELQNSNNKLQSILEQINTLPEAGVGGAVQTATVTIIVNQPLSTGFERVCYVSVDGLSYIDLIDYELSSVDIDCIIPSIIGVSGATSRTLFAVSGDILVSPSLNSSSAQNNIYYVTGEGSLVY